MNESELSERLEQVQGRIRNACDRAGREPDDITLLGVSKFHGPEAVAALARRGLRCFGESRVQEARIKIPQCPGHIEWHMVGHLQTNKCRDAVGLFKMIQSVDRLEVAEELQRQAEKRACTLSVLLEVNVAGESSKFGWSPDALKRDFLGLNNLDRLEIHGLMTIAPYAVDPEKVRPCFCKLRELRDDCADLLGAPLPVLSMGMSGDLEVAIEEGSTCVRVGTALFGPRPRGKAM
jgi:pyridoxal phosphate enzyme (YggS family)